LVTITRFYSENAGSQESGAYPVKKPTQKDPVKLTYIFYSESNTIMLLKNTVVAGDEDFLEYSICCKHILGLFRLFNLMQIIYFFRFYNFENIISFAFLANDPIPEAISGDFGIFPPLLMRKKRKV